jgi:hypothetical protein
VSPEASRLHSIGLQDVPLAPFKRSMRAEHRQRRQAPQQNERLSRNTSSPIAATDEDHDGDDARRRQNNVSRPPQRNQIRVVLVGCCENHNWSGEPDEDDANTFENLHEMDGGLRKGIERGKCPYQTCPAHASA